MFGEVLFLLYCFCNAYNHGYREVWCSCITPLEMKEKVVAPQLLFYLIALHTHSILVCVIVLPYNFHFWGKGTNFV